MVTYHVIYAQQSIHQKLISTAQILTNNLQNTFCQKHSNIGYQKLDLLWMVKDFHGRETQILTK